MRTNYTSLAPRRTPRSPWRVALALAAAAVAVGTVLLWRGALGGLFWQLASPVVALRDSFSVTKVAALTDELARAKAAAADRDILAAENTQLRQLLGRAPAGETRVLASVLQRPPGTPYDTLLVDVGARHGVVVGQQVSAGGSVMLGDVTTVNDSTSVITLYSAPGRELAAVLLHGATSVPLKLSGQGAGSFVAELPSGTQVAVGDSVVLTGVPGGMPGTVSAVVAKEGESFVKVYLHLPVNLFDLRYVEVALPTH